MALGVQFIISVVLYIIILAIFLGLLILIVRCLLKYLKSTDVRHEKAIIRKSLGEVLKENRIRCKMTQALQIYWHLQNCMEFLLKIYLKKLNKISLY